ncbi:MAG: hemerythrin domain-containing protein [Pseudomonadota bacterium]
MDEMEQHCLALCALVRRIGDEGPPAELRPALAGLRAAFLRALALHRAQQETRVFPGLLDAMAGSDAVCIREMAADLADEHRALDLRWRRLCDALEAALQGSQPPGHGLAADAEALLALCRRHLAFEREQLWPMAARLLDGPEMPTMQAPSSTLP